MDSPYRIVYVEDPGQSAWGIIGRGIDEYNREQAGDYHGQTLCYAIQAPGGEIAGGVVAQVYWDWLYVDLMWMRAELRGQGYGHELLTRVEEEARRRGAKQAFLDTFSFQAPGFYEKHGYRVFGELADFPHGHRRFYMTKEL